MSTTLELPDDVMREVEKHASRSGINPDEFLATFLRNRLIEPAAVGTVVPKRLPLIKGRPATPDSHGLSQQEWCDWLKEQDLQLEVERHEKALGYQFVARVNG